MNYRIARQVEAESHVRIECIPSDDSRERYRVSITGRSRHGRWADVYRNANNRARWGVNLREPDDHGGYFQGADFPSPLACLRMAAQWVRRGRDSRLLHLSGRLE